LKGKIMATAETQIWKSARLTIERGDSEEHGTVFRFYGPFTGRDMYNSLSPDAFRSIFESAPGKEQPPTHVFDLREVPYMDSTGLGMLASHYVRCQSKGIQLSIVGVNPRVQELFRLTGMVSVLPIASV
jgi:anti-anti-sigma factor